MSLGTCIFDFCVAEKVRRLWEGPVSPADLDAIELGLRALLIYENITPSMSVTAWESPRLHWEANEFIDVEAAERRHLFDHDMLDNVVVDSEIKHYAAPISPEQSNFLTKYVVQELNRMIPSVLPDKTAPESEFAALLDKWYSAHSRFGPGLGFDGEPRKKMITRDQFLQESFHSMLRTGVEAHALYFVKCHSHGYGIVSCKPIAQICYEHIFARWPMHLFNKLSADFQKEARLLLSPGFSFPIPPVTLLVLSRAYSRGQIPGTLLDLRDEFKKGRKELWELLSKLWRTTNFGEQLKIQRALENAANSIFAAAFPETINSLSVALDFAQLTPDGIASGMNKLLDYDTPNRQVKAISFAAKLSKQLRIHLKNQTDVLKRHLTRSELVSFGKF